MLSSSWTGVTGLKFGAYAVVIARSIRLPARHHVYRLDRLKDVYWVLSGVLPVLLADADLSLDVATSIMYPPWDLHVLVHVDGVPAPRAHAPQQCPRVRGCEVRQRRVGSWVIEIETGVFK
jgi:hypothetical protein